MSRRPPRASGHLQADRAPSARPRRWRGGRAEPRARRRRWARGPAPPPGSRSTSKSLGAGLRSGESTKPWTTSCTAWVRREPGPPATRALASRASWRRRLGACGDRPLAALRFACRRERRRLQVPEAQSKTRAPVPTIYIETYGCQRNVPDTELISAHLADHGWARAEEPEAADVILLNPCAIREHAEARILGR